MPGKIVHRASLAWEKWSPSKINTATSCPLRCYYEYILRMRGERFPLTVFGSALHYMFEKFFKAHKRTGNFPYQEVRKFQNVWKGFWWRAVAGHHGFSNMGSDPEEVPWKDKDQVGQLFGAGWNILGRFYDRYQPFRMAGNIHIPERRFTFDFCGLTLNGVIDRIDLFPEHAVILDYKSRIFPKYDQMTGTQLTAYQLAYEQYLRNHIGQGRPLQSMQVYGYWKDAVQDLPLRDDYQVGMLFYYMLEASEYYRTILTGRPVRREIIERFRFFPEEDVETGNISPRLPRGNHCNYCENVETCLAWEKGEHDTPRKLFADKYKEKWDAKTPTQISLPFQFSPVVRIGANNFYRLKNVPFIKQHTLF